MLRAMLVFVVGALVGANAVYFVMTRGDRCARCEAASVVTEDDPTARTRPPDARTPTPPASAVSPPTRSPDATSPASPPPAPATPLPAATTGNTRVTPELAMPLGGLTAAQLRDTFSEARGGERQHEALDILAPAGTPVLAVADGHIEKLFNSVRGGLTVYQFDPTRRYAYYYAHLQRYAPGLSEGKQVKEGDVIAYVGSTGNADPAAPHLHFAIFELGPERQWWKGTPVNPYPMLGGVAKPAAPRE